MEDYFSGRAAVNGVIASASTLAPPAAPADESAGDARRPGRPRSRRVESAARATAKTKAAGAVTRGRRVGNSASRAHSALLKAARFGPWALALVFLAVSMPHLADGFRRITGWLMAVAIDSAQVVSKLQLTIAKSLILGRMPRVTSFGIILATSALSMALNCLAFLQHADGPTGVALAWIAGLLLPLFILGLSYTGSSFCLAPTAHK